MRGISARNAQNHSVCGLSVKQIYAKSFGLWTSRKTDLRKIIRFAGRRQSKDIRGSIHQYVTVVDERSQRTCGTKDDAQCAKSFSLKLPVKQIYAKSFVLQEGGKVRTSAGAYISM
ncbi:hypothetical protein [Morganella psychrotolerans]|uniref:hypothetical protein n=1 Tax=Morganella psychrotolerans TaxID=368603 RepID=UPI0039B03E15